jgi:hypothetical protein
MNKDSNKYFESINSDGETVLCPFNFSTDRSSEKKEPTEDCFEKDVRGRYASNIEIVD